MKNVNAQMQRICIPNKLWYHYQYTVWLIGFASKASMFSCIAPRFWPLIKFQCNITKVISNVRYHMIFICNQDVVTCHFHIFNLSYPAYYHTTALTCSEIIWNYAAELRVNSQLLNVSWTMSESGLLIALFNICMFLQVKRRSGRHKTYLPHSFEASVPAPHPPSPNEPSLSQYHSAAFQSAPLGYDKTLPGAKQRI